MVRTCMYVRMCALEFLTCECYEWLYILSMHGVSVSCALVSPLLIHIVCTGTYIRTYVFMCCYVKCFCDVLLC